MSKQNKTAQAEQGNPTVEAAAVQQAKEDAAKLAKMHAGSRKILDKLVSSVAADYRSQGPKYIRWGDDMRWYISSYVAETIKDDPSAKEREEANRSQAYKYIKTAFSDASLPAPDVSFCCKASCLAELCPEAVKVSKQLLQVLAPCVTYTPSTDRAEWFGERRFVKDGKVEKETDPTAQKAVEKEVARLLDVILHPEKLPNRTDRDGKDLGRWTLLAYVQDCVSSLLKPHETKDAVSVAARKAAVRSVKPFITETLPILCDIASLPTGKGKDEAPLHTVLLNVLGSTTADTLRRFLEENGDLRSKLGKAIAKAEANVEPDVIRDTSEKVA